MAPKTEDLIKLRENIDNYLYKKEQEKEKSFDKMTLAFENARTELKSVFSRVQKGEKGYQQVNQSLNTLRSDLTKIISASKVDLSPVLNSLTKLSNIMASKRGYSDNNVLKALASVEKRLYEISQKDFGSTKAEYVDRTDEIVKAIQGIEIPQQEYPDHISIDNFPPQKIPQPVTNININPLRGLVETTAQTLTTSLQKVPGYGQLENRRTVMVYNNDASTTIFLGGSDLTSSNGLPVPALSYSPSFDIGENMILYGLTSSGTAEIRVIELSNDEIGG